MNVKEPMICVNAMFASEEMVAGERLVVTMACGPFAGVQSLANDETEFIYSTFKIDYP